MPIRKFEYLRRLDLELKLHNIDYKIYSIEFKEEKIDIRIILQKLILTIPHLIFKNCSQFNLGWDRDLKHDHEIIYLYFEIANDLFYSYEVEAQHD